MRTPAIRSGMHGYDGSGNRNSYAPGNAEPRLGSVKPLPGTLGLNCVALKDHVGERDIMFLPYHANGGYGIGIAYACCMAGSIIPCIGILAGLASLVLWIIYWVKIAGYNQLMLPGGSEMPV